MQTCWYIIIEALGHWWVDCEGKAFGPFYSEDEARGAAPSIALTYGDGSRRAEVWVTGSNGRQRRIWIGPNPS